MGKTLRSRQLRDAYRFTGFVPAAIVRGAFGDPLARVLTLRRRQKKLPVGFVGCGTAVFTTRSFVWFVTCRVASTASILVVPRFSGSFSLVISIRSARLFVGGER